MTSRIIVAIVAIVAAVLSFAAPAAVDAQDWIGDLATGCAYFEWTRFEVHRGFFGDPDVHDWHYRYVNRCDFGITVLDTDNTEDQNDRLNDWQDVVAAFLGPRETGSDRGNWVRGNPNPIRFSPDDKYPGHTPTVIFCAERWPTERVGPSPCLSIPPRGSMLGACVAEYNGTLDGGSGACESYSLSGPGSGPTESPPDAPTITGIEAYNDGSNVRLSWEDPGDPDIASYEYRIRQGDAWTTWRTVPGSNADTTSVTIDWTELGPGEYRIDLRARDVNGNAGGATSIGVSVPEPGVSDPPDAPTGSSPGIWTSPPTDGSGSLRISWENPGDPDIAYYEWRRRHETVTTPWRTVRGSNADTTRVTIGLPAPGQWDIDVRACDVNGNCGRYTSWDATVPEPGSPEPIPDPGGPVPEPDPDPDPDPDPGPDPDPDPDPDSEPDPDPDPEPVPEYYPPEQPTGVEATTDGSGSVTLSWSNPGDPDIATYEYSLRPAGGPPVDEWTTIPGSNADTTSVTIDLPVDATPARWFVYLRARGMDGHAGRYTETIVSGAAAAPEPGPGPGETVPALPLAGLVTLAVVLFLGGLRKRARAEWRGGE